MATTNDSNNGDSSTQEPRYRSAFNRLLEIIRAVPPQDFAPVNLDVMASVRTTEGVLPKIAVMKPIIAKVLVSFPMEFFDQLEDRALALGHAQTVYESTRHPTPSLQTLSRAASSAHGIALSEVNILAERGLIPKQKLANLKGGNGYWNRADDLFTLSEMVKSNWSKVSNRTTVTLAELDHLEQLADQINQALGVRKQHPEVQARAARERQAAYTLFIKAYNEVRAAIVYVRRNENDADTLMPSLYAKRNGRKKKPAVKEPVVAPPAANNQPVPTAVVTPAVQPTAETKPEAPAPAKPEDQATLENGPFMR
jgi:hypothetical protein